MSDTSKKYNSLVSYHYPAVSVIIPMYNAEKYIGECLNSLLLQTFQDFEVIVVDDCSTDNSVVAAEKYIPKFNGRLRIFSMKKNTGGAALPRNKGLKMAFGEYIQFLDADDFLLGIALETLYKVAKEYDAEVVYNGSYYDMRALNDIYLRRDIEGINLIKAGLEDKTEFRIDNPQKSLKELLLTEGGGNFTGPWSKFIRRDFLIENEISFPNMPISEDFIWITKIYCLAKRFLRISQPLYFYRRHQTSVTGIQKEPTEHLCYWMTSFVDFVKNLREIEMQNNFLSKNPVYCFEAIKTHFVWYFWRMSDALKQLSNQDVYETLHNEFAKDLFNYSVPFFFSLVDADRKSLKNNLQTTKRLQKEVADLKNSPPYPVISVIIPLYNTEKYIGECLDSLLNQTFKNFEIIVVDDCSTDDSVAVVKSYSPKFNGRLTLAKMKKNSGNGGLQRNKGLLLSRGKYIQFLDADDMLTKTALEDLYTLAKNYDADIINCEKYYEVNPDGTNSKIKSYQRGGFVDKPTFEPEDLQRRIQNIIDDRYLTVSWNKFAKRDLLMENEIFFPALKSNEDSIWTQDLILHAEKILRVPNVVYIHRASVAQTTPQQTIISSLNSVLFGLKTLDDLMSKHEVFKENSACRFALLKNFIDKRISTSLESTRNLSEETIYSILRDEFGGKLGEYGVLIPALCTVLYNENISAPIPQNDTEESLVSDAETLRNFKQYFMARLDIKLLTKNKSDFQIISISDDRADVRKPDWFNKDGVGYQIQSYVGKLNIVFNAIEGGMISLGLRSLDMRNPKETSKRIPYWIDYTKLIVNDKVIFDELTPAWHDKPFRYDMVARAGEDISISVEWLPHRSDN